MSKEIKTVNKPTPLQKRAMQLFVHYAERHIKQGVAPPSMGQILVEAGYKESIRKQPAKITNSPAWKEFLNDIDDTEIVNKWAEWAKDDDPQLRGHALKAGENIMKLKDRYPGAKGRVSHIHSELKDLFKEEEPEKRDYNIKDNE